MEPITEEIIKSHLKDKNINLSSTHSKLSIPIIQRILKKMKSGIKFDSIKVNDDLIIDGHHRYISSILANFNELEIIAYPKTSATKKYDWDEVDFVNEEWDTEQKIKRLNEIDAEYNNLSLEEIIAITK